MIFIKLLLLHHYGIQSIWSFLFCLPIYWWWKLFNRSVYEKHFYWHNLSHSAWPWQWRANNLGKTESPSKVWMWGVNSIVTKHLDYLVWKDTWDRVTRRCDDTVDKKRVNSCVLKYNFLEGVEQPLKWPKKPRNALSDALLMRTLQVQQLSHLLPPQRIGKSCDKPTMSQSHVCKTMLAQCHKTVTP